MYFIGKIIELFSNQNYVDSLLRGLKITIVVSVLAAVLGLFLGTIAALVSIAPDSKLMKLPKLICRIYITVIRGTPMALQLFIMFYVIFSVRGFPEVRARYVRLYVTRPTRCWDIHARIYQLQIYGKEN